MPTGSKAHSKWKMYIHTITKDAVRIVSPLCCVRKCLTPAAMLYFCKSQIRPRIMYCFHNWAGAAQSSLSSSDKIQTQLHSHMGDELFSILQSLSHRWNVARLSLHYCYGRGSDKWQFRKLKPSQLGSAMFTVANHPHSLCATLIRSKFHSDIFPRTYIWEQTPERMLS